MVYDVGPSGSQVALLLRIILQVIQLTMDIVLNGLYSSWKREPFTAEALLKLPTRSRMVSMPFLKPLMCLS